MCPLPCNSEGSPASSPRTLPRNLDGCRTPLLSPTFSLDDSSDELMGSHGTNTEPIITPQSRSSPISTWQESTWFCSPVVALINRNEEAQLPKCFSSNPNQQVLPNSPNRDDPRDENDTTENVALKYNRETFCDVQETYKNGLLPCFVSLISDHCDSNSSSSGKSSREEEVRWNGHLPLSQMPDRPSTQIPTWLLEQRPKLFLKSPLLDHNAEKPCPLLQSTFPVTLTGPEVEIFFHSNDNSDNNAADDGKKVFRRPNSAQSLSIPSGQAAKIAKDVSTRIAKTETAVAVNEPETPMMRPDGIEIVQTPRVGSDPSCMKELPPLRDAPPAKREELFIAKLRLCGVIYSFDDPSADKRGKDMKRQTLLELVDYVNTPAGQKIFTESVMGDLMAMVSANVCRALPPATDDFDPEEDEPVLEPAWPHLQVAYEFFLRFIVSSEVNAKAAKKYVDQKFCLQLVELFDSEDPRERDYLKTILHRIYGKFMSHRSFIRRAISNVFYRFVYETERHNGIGELLEILGSIINGFAIPLKKEHLQFLVRALIPLHKPKCVALYHQQLSYCIIQYVEKDADTAIPILEGFFRCWPWSCSGKQVMFLNELEEILELLGADQLAQVSTTLFTNLARCLDSDHFQVVERALFLWNNEHLVNSGCLSRLNAQTVLPIIYGPLYKNSSGHWNATVEGLAQNVLKMYMEYDLVLYDKCTAAYFREEEEAKRKLEAVVEKWNSIEKDALAKKAVAPV